VSKRLVLALALVALLPAATFGQAPPSVGTLGRALGQGLGQDTAPRDFNGGPFTRLPVYADAWRLPEDATLSFWPLHSYAASTAPRVRRP
jgi:hypothetical protein